MQVYITAIEEGFLYGLLALGIYISLRILDIPDLTTEGSFGFGSAVAAIVASKGLSVTSFIAAFAAGVLAGIVTGVSLSFAVEHATADKTIAAVKNTFKPFFIYTPYK